MSQFFDVHPENPQIRLLRQAAQILHDGGLAAVPTDSSYALVCHLDDKEAVEKMRRVRGVDDKHHLTLLCRDLSELANYARVDNRQYRMLKMATPITRSIIRKPWRRRPVPVNGFEDCVFMILTTSLSKWRSERRTWPWPGVPPQVRSV